MSAATFKTTFGCGNCGSEWTEKHEPRTMVKRSKAQAGVVVADKDCDAMFGSCDDCCYVVSCPTCELRDNVEVEDRAPVEEAES